MDDQTELPTVVLDGRYVSDRYPGIGRYVFNLAKALKGVAPQLSVDLLVAGDEPQSRFDVGALQALGVRLVAMRWPLRSIRGYLEGARAGRRRRSTVFHSPHILSGIPAAGPSLVTIHDLIPTHVSGELRSTRDAFVYRLLLRRALAKATTLVTTSRTVSAELEARWGVTAERLVVTPCAADPAFRPVSRRQIDRDRERLGLPQRYALYVGTDRPHKNLSRLIEAWSTREGGRDGYHLVIAGSGKSGDDRRTHARQVDRSSSRARISFLGRVDEDDLPGVYRGAQFLVHPALMEGFGLPVIEAMACGVPVACSGAPSLDEVCGDAALRFDPTDVTAIAGAIDRLIADGTLRDRLAAAGRERAGELSWERTAERTLAAYRRAALQAAPHRA